MTVNIAASGPPGRHRPRTKRADTKRATRASLQEAALDLFAERGYEAVTSREIAEAAGVSERTFFRYFPTKDAVVLWYVDDDTAVAFTAADRDRGVRDLLESRARWLAGGDAEHRVLLARSRIVFAHPALRAAWLDKNWVAGERAAAAVSDLLGHDAAARRETRLLAGVLFATACVVLQQWSAADGQPALDTALDRAFAGLAAS